MELFKQAYNQSIYLAFLAEKFIFAFSQMLKHQIQL